MRRRCAGICAALKAPRHRVCEVVIPGAVKPLRGSYPPTRGLWPVSLGTPRPQGGRAKRPPPPASFSEQPFQCLQCSQQAISTAELLISLLGSDDVLDRDRIRLAGRLRRGSLKSPDKTHPSDMPRRSAMRKQMMAAAISFQAC